MLNLNEIETLVPATFKNSDLIYVCVLDIEGQIYFASKKFEKLLNASSSDLYEKNFLETLNKVDKSKIHDFFIEVIERPNNNSHIELLHGNTTVNWEFSVMKNGEGDFSGILGLGYPKSSSYKISSDEKSFPKEVNTITDVFFQLNHSWEIISANDQAEKYFGRSERDLLSKTIWQIYPDQNIYRYALEFKKAKESKNLRIFEEFSSINGKWYKVYIIPRNTGMDIVFKDISELQQLSDQFKKTNLTFHTVIENSEECMFFVGRDLKILNFNLKAEKLVASIWGKKMKVGDKFLPYMFDGLDEFFLKSNDRIFKGETIAMDHQILPTKWGEKIWFSHKFYPLMDTDDRINGFVYACKDINEEKIALDRLKLQNRLMRDVFHQQSTTLRAPLSSILGLLELIDYTQLDKENKKYFSYLKPLAQELDNTIRKNSKQVSDLD